MTRQENTSKGRFFTDITDIAKGFPKERLRGRELMADYNLTRPSEIEKRISLAKKMFKKIGEQFRIEPPVYFSYGSRVSIGEEFYADCNLTLIDDWEVDIGDGVLIGPNVTICTTIHPLDPGKRRAGYGYGFKVIIEDDVWVGSGALISPDVTIGRGSVIGAGSVVTRDIPPYVIAAGNPCNILRPIGPDDAVYYSREKKISNLDSGQFS